MNGTHFSVAPHSFGAGGPFTGWRRSGLYELPVIRAEVMAGLGNHPHMRPAGPANCHHREWLPLL